MNRPRDGSSPTEPIPQPERGQGGIGASKDQLLLQGKSRMGLCLPEPGTLIGGMGLHGIVPLRGFRPLEEGRLREG